MLGPDRAEQFAAHGRAARDGPATGGASSTSTRPRPAAASPSCCRRCSRLRRRRRRRRPLGRHRRRRRFFEITKRIHNHLYGTAGDGGPLGADGAPRLRGRRSRRNVDARCDARAPRRRRAPARPADGRAGAARSRGTGARVVWRCHVGIDDAERALGARRGTSSVRTSTDVDALRRSRARQFAPPWVPRDRLAVIPPSIDPFSAKNEPIEPTTSSASLAARRARSPATATEPPASFTRRDGTPGRITRRVDLLGTGPPPPPTVPIVLQASRWDAMKDMPGVMIGFAEHVAAHADAHLVLAGPESSGVADDPEAGDVLARVPARVAAAARRDPRSRVHLACVPMTDADEAADDRQRAAAPRHRRRAEEPRRGLRPDGHGGDVEGAAGRRRARSAASSTRSSTARPGCSSMPHDLDAVRARGVARCSPTPRGAMRMGAAGRERVRTSSSATAISSNGRSCRRSPELGCRARRTTDQRSSRGSLLD